MITRGWVCCSGVIQKNKPSQSLLRNASSPERGSFFLNRKRVLFMKPNIVPKNGDMLPRARELRREMTPQEKKLWYQFLRHYPVKIYKQRIIESFIADFYCSRAQLVIELDGAQHTTEQGLLYDRERSSVFSQYGLEVLRFSNHEVDFQFEAVCERIHQVIQSRL